MKEFVILPWVLIMVLSCKSLLIKI